jgi:transglutaminase-like putative cysteine protease
VYLAYDHFNGNFSHLLKMQRIFCNHEFFSIQTKMIRQIRCPFITLPVSPLMHSDLSAALLPTPVIDSDHPSVQSLARSVVGSSTQPREQAVRLYMAVRDGYRYDPYHIDMSIRGMSASQVIAQGFGWCIPKAVLLAAACRAVGIPARVGLADVRNHMSTARLREKMGTDVFYRHGYTAIHLDGQWLKATPAFNIELCQKMRLRPLEFDGTADSIYHPFDLDGQRHMEYIAMHGEHDDLPLAELRDIFARHYPQLLQQETASWDDDVNAEQLSANKA